jgi:hypothetical protein
MGLSEALLPEFDQEMTNTRKRLERAPDDKLAWKPREKSFALGPLANHIAFLPAWAVCAMWPCKRKGPAHFRAGPV